MRCTARQCNRRTFARTALTVRLFGVLARVATPHHLASILLSASTHGYALLFSLCKRCYARYIGALIDCLAQTAPILRPLLIPQVLDLKAVHLAAPDLGMRFPFLLMGKQIIASI